MVDDYSLISRANNSNDGQERYEMMEMPPTGNNNRGELAEEGFSPQETEKLIAGIRWFGREVVCLLMVCLLALFGIGVIMVVTAYTVKEVKSVSSSLDVTSSTSPTPTETTTTEATTTESTYTNRSLTYLSTTGHFDSDCLSTSYRANGDILVGTRMGVKLVHRKNMSITSYENPFWEVTSIVDHHNAIYLLFENCDSQKAALCRPNLSNCQELFEFNLNLTNPIMDVYRRYIVVHGSGKLISYKLINQTMMEWTLNCSFPPYFLPDERLLAIKESTLSKYRLEEGELTEQWNCTGLEGVKRIVADAEGYIYGLTLYQTVYIISPDGKLLQEIHNERLPDDPGQPSLRGNELVVPGERDDGLHLFKINKE